MSPRGFARAIYETLARSCSGGMTCLKCGIHIELTPAELSRAFRVDYWPSCCGEAMKVDEPAPPRRAAAGEELF